MRRAGITPNRVNIADSVCLPGWVHGSRRTQSNSLNGGTLRTIKLALSLHVVALGAVLSRAFAHGTADEVAQAWATGISNKQAKMTAGVQAVRTAPSAAAIANRQRFVQKMQDPATFDKWERGLRGVSLAQWVDAMTSYGIQRAAQGAQQKQAKVAAAFGPLLQAIDTLRGQVRSMPNVTEADRDARMLAWSRGMRQYKKPTA